MANPPIVIGPFDNVPAPGSPIRSDWPQEISQYVVDLRTFAVQNPAANVNGVVVGNDSLTIVAVNATYTTNSGGDVAITFPAGSFPFGIPVIVATGANTVAVTIHDTGITAASFNVNCRYADSGNPVANGTVRIYYTAIGRRF